MAIKKVLARGWKLEIQKSDLSWVQVKGLNTLAFDSGKADADTTDFDDNGNDTHLVASRTRTVSPAGFYLEDPDNGDRDEGQELVEQLADNIGNDSIGSFRLTSPYGTVRNFEASAAITSNGGGKDDPSGWAADINVSGTFSFAAVADTSISVTPATLALSVSEISDVLTTVFTPANTTDQTLTYSTSDDTKAVVTAEGRVIGIAAGSATITVTSAESNTDTCVVTVT